MSRVQLNGKTNGQPGRPRKNCGTGNCPSVQYCNVAAKCLKACKDNQEKCEGGSCPPTLPDEPPPPPTGLVR